jgi:hypothetical protein
MRGLREAVERRDLVLYLGGAALTIAVAAASVRVGPVLGIGSLVAILAFLVVLVGFLVCPHIVVAVTIPLFALLPVVKIFVTEWLGPTKDMIVLAAACALLVRVLQHRSSNVFAKVDKRLLVLTGIFLALYVVNLGGGFDQANYGIAWFQGIRLVAEPMILLLTGLTLKDPGKTLDVAAATLIGTGCVVALYGILQQKIGGAGLVDLGYSWNVHVRTIAGRLRSFGTLDDPFTYAAFLMLSLTAVIFWMKRGPLAYACGSIIAIGLLFSYVRSALMMSVVLLAIWLVRKGRTALGMVLLAVGVVAAVIVLLASAGANQAQAVPTGPQSYITLNGRTTVWSTVFADPAKVPFGIGVGKIGTAAQRAQFGIVKGGAAPRDQNRVYAVDSGYFAAMADTGLIGLAVLLMLFWRIGWLARRATRRPGDAGWLALGWMTTLLIDAVTRESFTGFPTAFLGLLLVGVALAAAGEQRQQAEPAPVAARRIRRVPRVHPAAT